MSYGLFSPLIRSGFPDWKEDSSKWLDFQKEQLEIFDKGYQVGGTRITGDHYFFLNYYKLEKPLKGGKGKEVIAPYFIDVDKEFFDLFEWCEMQGWNLSVLKGRDKGLSQFASSIALRKTQTMYGASVITLFPGGESPALSEFRDKYKFAHSCLPDVFKQNPINGGSNDKREYHWIDQDLENKSETIKGHKTKILFSTAVSKDVTKSGRNAMIFVDEAGEIKDPLGLVMAAESNLRSGSDKTGIILIGGTSNTMNAGYEDFQDIVYKGEDLGFKCFKIYAQEKRFPFVDLETGRSLREEAKAEIEQEANKRKKVSLKAYNEYLQNNPTEEAHFFLTTDEKRLDAEKLSEQRANIMTNKWLSESTQKGNLYRVMKSDGTSDVKWEINPLGKWTQYLPPMDTEPNKFSQDIAGVDSVFKDIVKSSGSKNAIVVYRPFISLSTRCEMPVLIYHHRYNEDNGKEMFYEDMIMTLQYSKCKAIFESCDQELIPYFAKYGLLKYLYHRPQAADSPYAKPSATDFGVNPSSKEAFGRAEQLLQTYVKNKTKNIVFLQMIDDALRYGEKRKESDSDLTDAFKWALLQADANIIFRPSDKVVVKKKAQLPEWNGKDWVFN